MFSTDNSKRLYERACQSLTTGVSTGFRRYVTPVPLYFERGDGPYLYDVDGHQMLDYALAWGPLILGNNHPVLNEAVSQQLSRAYTYGAQHRGEIELAELIVRAVPSVERVILANTGSEAVQAAIRIARAHTNRNKVICFQGHYHGWHNNIMVQNEPSEGQSVPATSGQPVDECSQTIVLPWNNSEVLKTAFQTYRDQIACVITEPILVNCGSCLPNDGYLERLVELCRTYGALSIFDEVITGFRIALGGAREYYGVNPDLSVYAKALAGGFPMAAMVGREEVFDVLVNERTSHYGTYNGNPVCVAATIATIKELFQPNLYERLHQHGNAIRDAIEQSAVKHGHQLVTTGVGTAFSVHFGLEKRPRTWKEVMKADREKYTRFRLSLLEENVYLLPDGRWYVGATHTDRERQQVVLAIEKSMHAL